MVKKFTIEVEMEERWINQFCSMLKRMEHLGRMGSSDNITIYSDGDGDFRPKFNIDVDFCDEDPRYEDSDEIVYDAG